jgi:hypothetical protein
MRPSSGFLQDKIEEDLTGKKSSSILSCRRPDDDL